MRSFFNLTYGDRERQVFDVYAPDSAPTVGFLYFHGGGITGGSKDAYANLAPILTAHGIALFNANYTLYPAAKYPEFICDAALAAKACRDYLKNNLGCDTLYIGGSSAGAYLSMMLCFDERYLAHVGMSNADIAGYLHDAGQPTVHFNVLVEHGENKKRLIVDERAPLYYVGLADAYPKMRFLVSDNDLAGRYEQTMLMLATLSHFGYTGFDHKVIKGKHCAYCRQVDSAGNGLFAPYILDFIEHSQSGR